MDPPPELSYLGAQHRCKHPLGSERQYPEDQHDTSETGKSDQPWHVKDVHRHHGPDQSPESHRQSSGHAAAYQGRDHRAMTCDFAHLHGTDGITADPGWQHLVDEESLHIPAAQVAPAQELAGSAQERSPLHDAGQHREAGEDQRQQGPLPAQMGEGAEG